MQPIGYVRSSYKDTKEIPKGPGAKHDAEGALEILTEFEPGLADIEGFSHLYVIWAFDRAGGFSLTATPPTDDRPHGVFATRSPRRPNPIGLTVVELLGREGAFLRVRGLDMLDGTPVLDIKPYLSNIPSDRLRRGWLAEAEARTAVTTQMWFAPVNIEDSSDRWRRGNRLVPRRVGLDRYPSLPLTACARAP